MSKKVTGSHFHKIFRLVIIKLSQMDLKKRVYENETMTLTLPSNKNPTCCLWFVQIFKLMGHESDFLYLLVSLNCFELYFPLMKAGIGSRNYGPIYPKISKL